MTTPPDFAAAREHVVTEVVRFARRLRADGVAVPANAALPAVEALAEVGLDDRQRVRAATHAVLVDDPRGSAVFDEAFPGFWYRLRTALEAVAAHDPAADTAGERGGRDGRETDVATTAEGSLADPSLDAAVEGSGELADRDGTVQSRRVADAEASSTDRVATDQRPGTASPVGRRSTIDDDGETGTRTVAAATIRRLERAMAAVSGRRWDRAGSGDAVDARRALRASMATGGVAMSLPRRERDRSAFRACVLVDVSRSVLDSVDRAFLLSVLDALVDRGRSVRVFFFDTDVRDVTDVFAEHRGDPRDALERAEVAWGGGTRIGSSLRTLRRRWPDAVDRRTVTLVVSDGLEVGETAALEAGAAWLARRSRAVVWLNPLAASPAYEPTCRGMAAVEPYVDGLFAFGGDADLDDVARQLSRRGPHGAVGYEHDYRDRTGGTPG